MSGVSTITLPDASATGVESTVGSPPAGVRYHHLDALRGALMFWGVLVHSGTLGKGKVFDWIGKFSGLVRMEAFFVIAGFLGAMVLCKLGVIETLKRRFVAIVVPLVVALLILNPATLVLMNYYHNGFWAWPGGIISAGETLRGPMNWHLHLWFLFSLLVFVMLSPVMGAIINAIPSKCERVIGRMNPGLLLAAVAVGAGILAVAARIFFEVGLKPVLPSSWHFIAKSTSYYLAFYFVGMLTFRSPAVQATLEKPHAWQALAAGVLLYVAYQPQDVVPDKLAEVLTLCFEAYLAITLTSLLMSAAKKLASSQGRVARFLSEASYTVYLFHFFLIYVLALLVVQLIPKGITLELIVAAAAMMLGALFHARVVKRSTILTFLFNGRIPTPRPRES